MTVGEIVPNTDATPNDWSSTGSPHCDEVNEDRTAPDTGSEIAAADMGGDDNDLEEFGFTTLDNIEDNSITQVIVWYYGRRDGGQPELAISWDEGANFGGYVECTLADNNGWHSNTFGGLSYSKADLDQFQISLRADVAGKYDLNYIFCIYVSVTYTELSSGWGHKFNGVVGANIGKISGVAIGNIGKVKGVAI